MRALVTGAAGGIGSATVTALRSAGHTVWTQDLRAGSAGHVDLEGDLNDAAHLAAIAAFVRENGIDTVVAAHGIAAGRALEEVDRAYSDRVMNINTLSFLRLHDAVREDLEIRSGCYVAISSQAGLVGEAANGAYCASKFALVGWARGMRTAGTGVRIRILCPGATETPLLQRAFEGMAEGRGITVEELLAERSAQIPAGRLGRTTDLGAAAAWLAALPAPRVLIAPVTGGEVLA
ncbi:SDR family NAD(P)-dependent oxidoreductase [Herbiconiux sp. P15]|uniref:SDR family NAD(P)-dependent oxidoreductase n=1 Tax=Herbiconiux liukaitaii TaxID=3342799 RepID=UPI0035BAE332